MQYLYSSKVQIQNPWSWAKCRDNRSSEQQRRERQFLKFVPFKASGFPLIAGALESLEQLSVDSINRNSIWAQSSKDESRAGAIAP